MESALQWLEEQVDVSDIALFLDFDGTLAPIVERPDDARPLDGVAGLVERLAAALPVAVISGRGLDDVSRRLGARGIYYSGSHGMEIQDPDGERDHSEELEELLPALDHAEGVLREQFEGTSGVEIERKRFGVAVHFRRRPEAGEDVTRAVEDIASDTSGLTWSTGKMVREVQPDVELDKGTALRSIWERINANGARRPMYIGDDRTDEDAFEEIRDTGIGILVAGEPRSTAGRLRLSDPQNVREFLGRFAEKLDVE